MSWYEAFFMAVAGGFVGAILGILVISLCVASREAEDRSEELARVSGRDNGRRPVPWPESERRD